jgi:hypothetical protein
VERITDPGTLRWSAVFADGDEYSLNGGGVGSGGMVPFGMNPNHSFSSSLRRWGHRSSCCRQSTSVLSELFYIRAHNKQRRTEMICSEKYSIKERRLTYRGEESPRQCKR